MSTTAVLASCGVFVGAVFVLGGLAAWVEVWRTQRRARAAARQRDAWDRVRRTAARREARLRVQELIEAEYARHGHSPLSVRLRRAARDAGGVA